MKILYVATDIYIPFVYGGSTHVLESAKALVKRGHNVHLICKGSKELKKEETLEGVRIHRILRYVPSKQVWDLKKKPKADKSKIRDFIAGNVKRRIMPLFAGLEIYFLMRRHDLDVIYERNSSFGAGAIASYLLGKPLILEVHFPFISPLSLQRARRILATSLKIVPSKYHHKVKLFTCNVDPGRFKFNPEDNEKIRRKYNAADKDILIYVGNFYPWHGVDILLKALARLKKVICFFVGNGPWQKKYEELAEDLRVRERCIFLGSLPQGEVIKYINAADIAVAPFDTSKDELTMKYGFYYTPLKIFEFMACSKPVVTSNIGNLKEIIKDGETGVLAREGSVESFVEAIRMLIENREKREEIGLKARVEVEKKYTWNKFGEFLEKEIKSVL